MVHGWSIGGFPGLLLGALLALPPRGSQVTSAAPAARAKGNVIVLSAPSGTGKSTLAKALVKEVPDLIFAVSHTTRSPRPGEVNGVDYFFVNDAAFDALKAQGRFAECVEIYGNRYALSRDWLQEHLDSGKDILMDLDTDGARQVRQALPQAVSVFLIPPSAQELARRLKGRGSETESQVAIRMGQAKHELSRYPEYDYLVVGHTVAQATQEVQSIIASLRARQERRRADAQRILEGF